MWGLRHLLEVGVQDENAGERVQLADRAVGARHVQRAVLRPAVSGFRASCVVPHTSEEAQPQLVNMVWGKVRHFHL